MDSVVALEDLVVSLAIAEQLKAAGWQRETIAYWNTRTKECASRSYWGHETDEPDDLVAAPGATEIAEDLPLGFSILKKKNGYSAGTFGYNGGTRPTAHVMADAVALLWIRLKGQERD